jgi:serine/threonine protein kinase
MSPALFKGIHHKQKNISHNPKKSDTWALGLSVLEAGLLGNIQNIYNHENGTIHIEKLQGHVKNFRDRYVQVNLLLCDIVENCLTVNEDYRLTCEDLLADIPAFEMICDHYAGNGEDDAGGKFQIKARALVVQDGKG